MDLHSIAAPAIGAVNPFIMAQVRVSTGYETRVDGVQVPAYGAPTPISIQLQALQYGDLQQLDALNIQGERRKVYVVGHYAAVIRVGQQGGDLLTFPQWPGGPARTWLVAFVFEQWPDWCALAVTLQVDS